MQAPRLARIQTRDKKFMEAHAALSDLAVASSAADIEQQQQCSNSSAATPQDHTVNRLLLELGAPAFSAFVAVLLRRPPSNGPRESLLNVLKRLKLKMLEDVSLASSVRSPASGLTCSL